MPTPYTALGCLLAAGLAGIAQGAALPAELVGDPGLLSADDREALGIRALPHDSRAVLQAFAADEVLSAAMGASFHSAYAAVKRDEIANLVTISAEERTEMLLERYLARPPSSVASTIARCRGDMSVDGDMSRGGAEGGRDSEAVCGRRRCGGRRRYSRRDRPGR